MNFRRRDIFLKIEPLPSYSPLAPVVCARHFGRDCMFNPGHDSGRIPAREILATTADGLVYREYLDSHYTVPNKAKLIEADVNEPPWDRRIPGCVLYVKPGERLYIHVLNGDSNECHSFHIHGLRFGIESDGAWPLGVATRDGRRSDEILPGQKWTYVYDVTPEMVGVWGFHDHAHDVARNVNSGLFGGLIVRSPAAPCPDHEAPVFVHQFAGSSGFAFQSKRLIKNETFSFNFTAETVVNYYCAIHGPTMNGTVQVVADGPASASVSIQDNKFVPPLVLVRPGGTVDWRNEGNHEHTVFSAGGAAPTFCLNGRAFVGNTPSIVGETGERLRWYIFNLDVSGIWHNFHPHSVRWALPTPPGGAADVHGISSLETFVTDTEIPPAMRLPRALEQFQWDPPENACRVRIRGDFLFHCHIEEHMMAGLAGLVRACQHIWISDEVSKMCDVELPFDDGMNDCPHVDMMRCLRDHNKLSASGHVHSEPGADQSAATEETPVMGDAVMGMGGAGMTGMGGIHGMVGGAAMRTVLSPEILEAATKGLWELLPCPAPILAVHGAVLHTGKILLFAGSGNDELFTTGLRSAVWDYENGEFVCPFTPVDFFCAGQTFLADGRLLVAGGTKEYDNSEQPFIGLDTSYLFDPLSESWIRVASMAEGRWYPTLVTLGDGRVFNVSGGPNRAEVYSSVGGWVQMPTQEEWPLFPHLFLARDGRLFYDGGNMFPNPRAPQPGFLDISTSTMTSVTLPEGFSQNRDHCGSVLLAPAQEQRFMIMGGGDPAINSAHIIDLKAAEPAFEEVAPMIHARFHINAVLLPDQTVFVSGGNGQSEIAATAVLEAEIYDPAKNTWIAAATAQAARMYHSIALLLPDGRVLAAGSNPNRRDDELRLEIYHPPYLFRGPRPFIETVPQQILYGGDFKIHTPQAKEIQWVELIWPMATTHSLETGQRVVDLEFEAHDFCHLHVKVLTEQNIAPPGWYMLFLVNKQGVPSVAKWVQLTGGEKPSHDPAEIKQRLDMRVTSKDRPVPGSKGRNY
ncbi:MAG TPA: galactose oxidase-like domain-containing protein [Nitrosospira sp.]|nr:galactose oxidase-like domain-containing protein [Nitrosospira sp.]